MRVDLYIILDRNHPTYCAADNSTTNNAPPPRILSLALPTSTVDTLSFVASLFSVSLVGSLGTVELSALTLGTTLFNITGLSL